MAIASHGRGFWVLDNMAPLRQATPNTTSQALVLFDPPAAYRSANGVTLSWWLNEKPNTAKLEILDASGEVLRTYLPEPEPDEEAEGEEEDNTPPDPSRRWAGPNMSTNPGLNYLQWDLKTQPAAVFRV